MSKANFCNSEHVNLIVSSIINSTTNAEAYQIFRSYKDNLKDWCFVLASDGRIGPGFAANKAFSGTAAARGLFPSERVAVLDYETVVDMEKGRADFFTEFLVSLDTQALSYIRSYFKGLENPKDISEVMLFIAQPNVDLDASLYLRENYHTILYGSDEKREKIFESLLAYEVLRSVDVNYLNQSGKIRSYLSEQERMINTQRFISSVTYHYTQSNVSDGIMLTHKTFYCILLKISEIQISKDKLSFNKKLKEIFVFLNDELGTMYIREIIIAIKYFQLGQNFRFFGRVQAGSKNLFKSLANMAWDLQHIRQCERGFSFSKSKKARYCFPAMLTFDNQLVEIIDSCPLKACLINLDRSVQPVYAIDPFDEIAKISEELAKELRAHHLSVSAPSG